MTVTFFFNYLNIHQLPVSDELYHLLGEKFRFVATMPLNKDELKGGKDFSSRPYCLLAAENSNHAILAHRLNETSDVCVFGAGMLDWEYERAKSNKLSFEVSERWFKRGYINLLSPRLWKWWWSYQTCLRHKPFYKLCASAFTASDCKKLSAFHNKCFKWGYFTKEIINKRENNHTGITRIMWCARLISWKHPELAVRLASLLHRNGYNFILEMYGDGDLRQQIQKEIDLLKLNGVVILKGNVTNERIHEAMANSDIFIMTSDRNEGWGAVLNESMANGCCPVASDQAGATPYMINPGENGLIYSGTNLESLYTKVKYLLDNPSDRERMALNAYSDLQTLWSPKNAAQSLLILSKELISNNKTTIIQGPCSKA